MTDRKFISRACRQLAWLGAGAACLVVSLPALADDNADDGSRGRRDRDTSRTHIAVDFDFGTVVDAANTPAGGGGAIRLGQEFDLFLVSLTPELGGSYHAFGNSDRRLYAGFIGGRLAVGKIIEPSIYGHVGVGDLSGDEARTAPLLDVGLALDFTLLPLIDLGLHGGYNVMMPRDDGSSLKFVTLGAQAALVL